MYGLDGAGAEAEAEEEEEVVDSRPNPHVGGDRGGDRDRVGDVNAVLVPARLIAAIVTARSTIARVVFVAPSGPPRHLVQLEFWSQCQLPRRGGGGA